jgi:alanine-synthesizing transaminase
MFSSRTDWSLRANRLSEEIEERRRRQLPLLDLTESNPTRCGFLYDHELILKALADRHSLTYSPDPRGLLRARQAVAGYYAERGVKVDVEQIFLTTSTSEAYSYIFRLLADPGENVAVPSPSYPLFDFLARLEGLELVHYPLIYDFGWRMDFEAIEKCLGSRTRAVLLVNPNNPTGSFVRQEELEFVVERSKGRSLALVADEVFLDYEFSNPADNQPRRSVLSYGITSHALSFTVSGLSKISALPQMKLAWIVVDGPSDPLKEALGRLEVIADTYLSVSAPLQHALPGLLETRRRLQPQILDRVRGNLRWLDAQLSSLSSVSRLEVEGGWYVILRLPSTRSDEDWALELVREDGVLVHPGHFYDFSCEGHLVLSLLTSPESFQNGVRGLLARVGS